MGTVKFVFKNITRKKVRTLAVILSIALSVALFVALDLSSKMAMVSATEAYTSYVGDFDILVYQDGFKLFNYTNATKILRNIEGIDSMAPRLTFGARLQASVGIPIAVVGLNLTMEEDIGKIRVVDGSLSLNKNECLVLDSLASKFFINSGENITVVVGQGENQREFSLKVSAIINQSGKLPRDITDAIFVGLETANMMINANMSANMIFIKVDPKRIDPWDPDKTISNILSIAKQIQINLGLEFVVEPIKARVLYQVKEGLFFQRIFLQAFSSITLIMSLVLILMVSLMNYYDRLREIGILRAIGASRRRVFAIYFSENLILGLIGGGAGILLGYWFFQKIKDMLIPKVLQRFVSTYILPTDTLLLGFALGILIVIVGGLYPSIKAVMLNPIEALQPSARRIKYLETIEKKISPDAIDSRLILLGLGVFITISIIVFMIPVLTITESVAMVFLVLFGLIITVVISIIFVFTGSFPKLIKVIAKPFEIINKILSGIAKGNIFRHRHRYIAIFFMLSLAVASLFTISFLIHTQIKTTEISMKMESGAPIVIYGNQPLPQNVTQILENMEGVHSYCPVTYYLWVKIGDIINWKTLWVKIQGINASRYIDSSYAREFGVSRNVLEELNSNGTVLISKGTAEYLGLKIGDEIRFELYGKTITLRVASILEKLPGFTFSIFSTRASGNDIVVSIKTFEEIMSNVYYSKIFVYPKNMEEVDVIADKIREELGKYYDVQVVSISDLIERSKESLLALESILSTILMMAIVVSVIGQFIGILTAVRERLWEIGVMRALGISRGKLALLFALEAFYVSVASFISGLLSAVAITLEITYLTNFLSEIPIILVMPQEIIIEILMITVLPITLASYVLAYLYARKNIAQILTRAEKL